MQLNVNTYNTPITIGYFGKLPGFSDFIKLNAAGNEIRVIDDWLQDSITFLKLKYKTTWKNLYDQVNVLNFIYPFTGTGNITFGVLKTAQDKSGRSFPFIVFNNISRLKIDERFAYQAPLVYEETFKNFHRMIEDNFDVSESKILNEHLSALKINPENISDKINGYKRFNTTAKINQVMNLPDGNEVQLEELLNGFLILSDHCVLIKLKADLYDDNEFYLIAFYEQLAQKVFNKSNTFPALFWRRIDEKNIYLFLFFSKPLSKDFLFLMYSGQDDYPESDKYKSISHLIRENTTISTSINLNQFIESFRNYLKQTF